MSTVIRYVHLWSEMHRQARENWEECVRFVIPPSVQDSCLETEKVEVSHMEVVEEWNKRGYKPRLVAQEISETLKGISFDAASLQSAAVSDTDGNPVIPFTSIYWEVNVEKGGLWE